MENKEFILSGPKLEREIFVGSLSELVIPMLKKQGRDTITQIDAATDESISSRDFLKMSLQVAEGLIKFGVKSDDVVVLACPNSIRCHAAAMGIIFSGAIFCPLDQSLKPVESQHLLNEFRPGYIICENKRAADMRNNAIKVDLNPKIVVLDSTEPHPEFSTYEDVISEVNVDNYVPVKVGDPKKISMIICSSGSTGLPKGVALSHESVCFSCQILSDLGGLGSEESIMLTSPLFWITGTFITLLSLVYGKTRIIPKSSDTEDLMECIQTYKPKFAFLSPSALMFMVEHPKFKKYDLTSLSHVLTGGSALGSKALEKIQASWKGVSVCQGYGMTEVCGAVCGTAPDLDLLSVGKLITNINMKIVDPSTGKSLGPHQIGECRFKTSAIMKGYYNNEKATKEAFDEDGWYKTGDLAYYTEEGLIYIVGRIKEAIKYRNYHISPAEIENFIMGIPGVKDVAIVPILSGSDYHLKAVVVKNEHSEVTADEIIKSVKENFSDYKHLRQGVEFVESLPRTVGGKLRRRDVLKNQQD